MKIKSKKTIIFPLNLSESAVNLEAVWIEPGSFIMGSPLDEVERDNYDEDDPFLVELTNGFWIGKYLITNAQWGTVMNQLRQDYSINPNLPKSDVSFDAAIHFCEMLGKSNPEIEQAGYKINLPTEAQWEYSCRAGTTSIYHNGDSIEKLLEVAWCLENSEGNIKSVGQLAPNIWGLHDMHGLLREWVYGVPIDYPKNSQENWIADPEKISELPLSEILYEYRCHRGGVYVAPIGKSFRSGFRGWSHKMTKNYFGIRICITRI